MVGKKKKKKIWVFVYLDNKGKTMKKNRETKKIIIKNEWKIIILSKIESRIDNLLWGILKSGYVKKKKKGSYAKIDKKIYTNWCECSNISILR